MPVYNRMVFQATIETAILSHLADPPPYMVPVMAAVHAWAMKARSALVAKARAYAAEWDGRSEYMSFFAMTANYKFGALATKLETLT
jgi:hypothetical protein